MTLIDGEKGKYINEFTRQNLELAKSVIQKDFDMIFFVDGAEGSGKSVLAMQLAYYCDRTININRICFSAKEFEKAVKSADKYTAVIYDEAYTGLSSRATMSLVNRTLINMLVEIRQRNLFIFILAPSWFDVDKYVVLHRSRGLFHVYLTDGFTRGSYAFYNVDRKKELYIQGKKFYNYRCAKPNFIADFTNWYSVDETAYRKKKTESLTAKNKETTDDVAIKEFKDNLFFWLQEVDANLTHEVKAKILQIPLPTYYYKIKKYNENRDEFANVDNRVNT